MLAYLSERGKKWVRTLPPLVKAHFDNFYNMYDKDTNPGGLINMGTAESHLVNREVCDLLRKAADRMDLTGYNLHYNKFEGSDEFRSAIAAHWQKVIFGADSDVVLTKDNVATCAGCTVALETLATLLAEPGDVFLIPAPYYSSFVDDINERAGVIAVGVPCGETLDRNAFEAACERVTAEGRRVRAVLFSSHTQSLLTALLQSPELEGVMDLSRQRLKTAYEIMTKGLADIGVPTMKAQAGIFIMADFSAYMDKQEFAEEHVLWQKVYNDLMINVSPGQLFGCDRPGWFRMCYAFEEDTVKEACRRLATLKK